MKKVMKKVRLKMSKRSCEYCRYLTDGCRCRARDERITSSIRFDDGCPHFEEPKQTVFDHITQSVEKLAEKMVFLKAVVYSYNAKDNTNYIEQWISTICNDVYSSKHEAITATIKELKKEVKDENKEN